MDPPPASRPASKRRDRRRRRRRRAAAAAATEAGADAPAGNQGGPGPGTAAGSVTSSRRRNRPRSRRRRGRNAAAAAGTSEKTEAPAPGADSTQGGSSPQAGCCVELVAEHLNVSSLQTTVEKIVSTDKTRKRNFQAGSKPLKVSAADGAASSSLARGNSVGDIESSRTKLYKRSDVRCMPNAILPSADPNTAYQNDDPECLETKDTDLSGNLEGLRDCCSLQDSEGYNENEPGTPLNSRNLEEKKIRRRKRGGRKHNRCKKTTSHDSPLPTVSDDNSCLTAVVSKDNTSCLKTKGRRKKRDQNKANSVSVDNAKAAEEENVNLDRVVEKRCELESSNFDRNIVERNELQEQDIASSSKDHKFNYLSPSSLSEAHMGKLKIVVSPSQSFRGFPKKKLLILDLNGLLADINQDYHNAHMADAKVRGKLVFRRPYCDDFLHFCAQNFELGIWSSRKKENVSSVVNIVMRDFKPRLLFCWDMSKCTFTGHKTLENMHKPLVLKELRKLWRKDEPELPWEEGEYSPSNTLLVDDSPYKALRNPPHTAIFPRTYSYLNWNDNSLGPHGDLRVYLQNLAGADDVETYVRNNPFGQPFITDCDPHWNFYSQIADRGNTPLTCA